MLWAGEGALDGEARRRLELADAIFLSVASVWEIEIKRAKGRLAAPTDLAERAIGEGFEPLGITLDHALHAGRLPLHHRDPFDRMLIAQARVEGMTLATADATFAEYDVPVLAVARA